MDLYNNTAGAAVSGNKENWTEQELIAEILRMVMEGELRVLKKQGGVFYSCEGRPLEPHEMSGNWENDKCMVPSDQTD